VKAVPEMDPNAALLNELAVETRRFYENKERTEKLDAFIRERVPPEVEERIREMHVEMADLLRKECGLKVPEIRRYLDEMRSLTI